MIRSFALANMVLLLVVLAGAQAQDLPDAGTIRLNSRLVYVDIIVRDHSGQVVHGLTQQDFKIEEDGRQQKVDFFAAHSFDPAAALAAARQSPAPAKPQLQFANVPERGAVAGAINIILFDLLNTPRSDLLYARKQLIEFLKKLPPGQSVALFVLTDTLHMVQNFTGSSDRLLAAAQAINPSDLSFIRSKSEAMQDDDFIAYFSQVIGRDPGGSAAGFKSAEGNQEAIRQDNRGYITVAALAELARATRGYPGRKNLLWLSEDFPVSVGAQITDERFRRGTPDLAQARETANLIADSQISVYPISLLGLEESGIPSSSSGMGSVSPMTGMGGAIRDQFNARQDLRYATNDLANQPGGEAFVGTNDFAGALRRSMLDGANYYTIAYRPSNDKWNGQFRKIHVELVGKSGSLDYRHGYFADPDTRPSSDRARDPRVHHAGAPGTGAAAHPAASGAERRFRSRSVECRFHYHSRRQTPCALPRFAHRPERWRATGRCAAANLRPAQSRSGPGSIPDRHHLRRPPAPGVDSQARQIPPSPGRQRHVHPQSRNRRHARGPECSNRCKPLEPVRYMFF
jgi:VWFA-related protein